jgi:toxin ParE1/3/4
VNYRLTQKADDDLERLIDFSIHCFGLKHTLSYAEGMKQKFTEIVQTPKLWQSVNSIRQGYRRSVYGKHSIYYRIDKNEIVIVRILGNEEPNKGIS